MCIFGLIKRKKKGFLSSVSFVCWFFFWFIGNLIIRRRRWRRKRKKIVQLTVKTQTHSHFSIYIHIYTYIQFTRTHTYIDTKTHRQLLIHICTVIFVTFLIFVNQLFSCFYFFNTKTTTKINFLCLRSSNYFFFLFFVKFLFFFLSDSFSLLLWLVKVVSE